MNDKSERLKTFRESFSQTLSGGCFTGGIVYSCSHSMLRHATVEAESATCESREGPVSTVPR